MKLINYAILMILGLGLMLMFADKGIAQNVNNAEKNRVIFEQPISFEDAKKMKIKVEQLEKEQNENNSGDADSLLDTMSNNSEQNAKVLLMMKALLKSMGIDELPEGIGLPEDNKVSEENQEQSRDKNNFKKWENRHNWKGLSTEQR